jgi:mannose-1-phosphate guanylyltransferase/mannose-6-phosphate isomerase
MYSVILCGGSGTRLWPLSRKNFPKQFLKLYSDNSLVQETFLRMKKVMPSKNIFFVTNKENYFNVYNQIRDLEKDFDKERILIEPASRNTAPAITLATKYLVEKIQIEPNTPIAFLPADHYIAKEEEFLKIFQKSITNVNGYIGTIGITPTGPETGFGYIKKGDKIGDFYKATEFKEKPNQATAQKYLDSKNYVWNSGMYLFNPKTFVSELKNHAPEIYQSLALSYENFLEKFSQLPDISIDFAISEKSDKVVVFEGEFGWSDIGSFDSLSEISQSLKQTEQKHIGINSKNVFVHSTNNRLVATLGIDDINVIENNDCILIQKKGQSEDVKKIVDYLKEHKREEIEHNIVSYRPWGSYEILIDTPIYKVKKIVVYPGSKLSLQSHYHRAEHWIVVRGLAKIVNGDKEIHLRENESTFIASLAMHRLENPGKINLELIEVQTGNYMGEDDIIRYEDIYNRAS